MFSEKRPLKLASAFAVMLSLWAASVAATAEPADPDVWLLQEAKIGTDNASLLTFLRQRSVQDVDLQQLKKLIRELGSETFSKREQASSNLVAVGKLALPALRQAMKDPDSEIASRARACVELIDKDSNGGLPFVAVRLLAQRKPPGAAAALLQYLPNAVGEELEEEIWFGLYGLMKGDPKQLPLLVPALKDAQPARRAVAACILGRLGNGEQKTASRKLLGDRDPMVRLRAAQGLLAGKDKAAIPVLITLLQTPSVALAWQAEELLHYVAEEGSEPVIGAGMAEGRKQCQAAWEDWWRQQGAKVDLTRLDDQVRRPGLYLLWQWHSPNTEETVNFQVGICGCNGRPMWLIDAVSRNVLDTSSVQLLAGDRILLDNTERDLQGKIVWERDEPDRPPVNQRGGGAREHRLVKACQRLPNGNAFMVGGRTVEEITSEGKVVYSYAFSDLPQRPTVQRVRRLITGRMICMENNANGWFLREREAVTGKEINSLPLPEGSPRRGGWAASIAPDGRCLVTTLFLPGETLWTSKSCTARELDIAGKTLRQWKLPAKTTALARLRNGNVLANCPYADGVRTCVFEVDCDGRIVWEACSKDKLIGLAVCLGLVRVGFDQPRPATLNLATDVSYRIKALKSKDPLIRSRSAGALGKLGPQAAPVIPALIEALGDAQHGVGYVASDAIYQIGPSAIPLVAKALKHPNPKTRAWAANLLQRSCSETKAALPQLLEALKDEVLEVRLNTLYSLGWLGRDMPEVIPVLIDTLQDKEPKLRSEAASALERIGQQAKAAIPALLNALNDDHSYYRVRAIYALREIGGQDKKVIAALIAALKDKDVNVRIAAAHSLGKIGAAAKDALPALLQLMKEDNQVHATAEEARKRILGE